MLISQIQPVDGEEAEQIVLAQNWIDSGAELFRTEKPTTPDPHLVCYFLLIDPEARKVLLVEHKKAALWLPSGGHVEKNEHPKETVCREIVEELGRAADFLFETPLFLTVRQTAGEKDKHTDVSLWYILRGSVATPYHYDANEFHSIRWFDPLEIPFGDSDPNMKRLLKKLPPFKDL
ncbi:MAG TPA: NUDIX domain-containing protein [Rhabdochlamydiaceae bacterium]